MEEPEDCLVEVEALNDEEQEESEADMEAAVPEEEVEDMEEPAVVLAVDTPAATYAHKVTEEEDKGDKHGPVVRESLLAWHWYVRLIKDNLLRVGQFMILISQNLRTCL